MSTVDFHAYDPTWHAAFTGLTAGWGLPTSARADHVGSTAVHDLPAKNCIDILIRADEEDHVGIVADVCRHGFEERPGFFADDPRRRFLRLVHGGRRVAHVHLTTWDHPGAEAMLAVRDLLRIDAGWRERYGALKASLATAYPADRGAYIDGKNALATELTEVALARRLTLVKRKLPSLDGLVFEAMEINSGDEGTYLLIPEGSRWRSPTTWAVMDRDCVVLIPKAQMWVAWWVPDPVSPQLRVDLCRPARRTTDGWSFVDLELDVFSYPDEQRVEVIDQQELAEQLRSGAIDPAEVQLVKATAHELADLLRSGAARWSHEGWRLLRHVSGADQSSRQDGS